MTDETNTEAPAEATAPEPTPEPAPEPAEEQPAASVPEPVAAPAPELAPESAITPAPTATTEGYAGLIVKAGESAFADGKHELGNALTTLGAALLDVRTHLARFTHQVEAEVKDALADLKGLL